MCLMFQSVQAQQAAVARHQQHQMSVTVASVVAAASQYAHNQHIVSFFCSTVYKIVPLPCHISISCVELLKICKIYFCTSIFILEIYNPK